MQWKPFVIISVVLASLISNPSYAESQSVYTVKDPQGVHSYNVNYTLTGATLSDMAIDTQETSLVILINSTSDGSIIIDLPRSMIDAKAGQADDQFIVLVDDTYTSFHESKTGTDRTLTVPFTSGSSRIEIIGTQVLPEFGSLPPAILAIALVSMVVFSNRARSRFRN